MRTKIHLHLPLPRSFPYLRVGVVTVALLSLPAAATSGHAVESAPACQTAWVDLSELDAAGRRWRRRPPPPTPHSWQRRLAALAPARVSVARSDGVYLGFGEVLGTTGAASERTSAARTAGWTVRATWDLAPLLAPAPPPPRSDPLDGIEEADKLMRRALAYYDELLAVAVKAADIRGDDLRCSRLRLAATGYAIALRTLLASGDAWSSTAPPPAPEAGRSTSRVRR